MNPSELWYARKDHMPLLGHRGFPARYPENTLPSFRAALDLGVDLIEFDVNVTRDGELVVIHDNTVDRTSNHTGRTRDYTLQELLTFDFSYKFPEFRGVRIPTLRQVLSLARDASDALLLNVEIKDMEHDTVDRTVEMLREYGFAERSVLACFDAEIIRYAKAAHPEMRCQGFPGRLMSNFTPETYDCMFGMGIPISLRVRTEEEVRADIAMAKERGILAWVYAADTLEDVRRCVEYDCDNITSNNPEMALNALRKMGLHE